MFNVGAPEILVILVVALVVLGPQRLPDAGRQLGRALAEFRKVRANVQDDLREMLAVDELRQALDVRSVLDDRPSPPRATTKASGVGAAAAAGGVAVVGAGAGAGTAVAAPDGAPSVPEAALVPTPTVDVPAPADGVGRDVLADAVLTDAVLADGVLADGVLDRASGDA